MRSFRFRGVKFILGKINLFGFGSKRKAYTFFPEEGSKKINGCFKDSINDIFYIEGISFYQQIDTVNYRYSILCCQQGDDCKFVYTLNKYNINNCYFDEQIDKAKELG